MLAALSPVLLWLGALGFVVHPCDPTETRPSTVCVPDEEPPQRDTLTGDWGGVRTDLEDAGIHVRAHHTSESAYNPRGGIFAAVRYTQQIDFGADIDLDRLAHVPGGKVFVSFTDRRGRSLSADAIGHNKFAVQEVFGGGEITRLVELRYQQRLMSGRLLVDVGREPLGAQFATSPIYCIRFQTLATCGTLELNNFNWANPPFSQWGARVRFRPHPDYYVSAGVYRANPRNANEGLDLGFSGTGVITPVEFGWLPGHHDDGLPGEYKVGGYYDSSDTPDVFLDVDGHSAGLTDAPFAQHAGRWGAFAVATQMVYRERVGSSRGLTLYGLVTTADPETETFRFFYVGACYQGTFAHRDNDFVSVLFAAGHFNDRLTRFQADRNTVSPMPVPIQTHERSIEVDYSVAVTPWLQLRPNLQYVIRPTGTGDISNPIVIGLLTRMTF